MSQLSQTQGLAAANSYLGLQVSVPTGTGASASTATGTVTGIDTSGVAAGSVPQLIVAGANGTTKEYPLTSVSGVQPTAPASSSSPSGSSSGSGGTSSTGTASGGSSTSGGTATN
jgi:hypothetical protein